MIPGLAPKTRARTWGTNFLVSHPFGSQKPLTKGWGTRSHLDSGRSHAFQEPLAVLRRTSASNESCSLLI